jgi:hypothetical protein
MGFLERRNGGLGNGLVKTGGVRMAQDDKGVGKHPRKIAHHC